MLHGHGAVSQALLGTFFTWGMTAAGAALVFVFSSGQRRILDGSLGFAAGVMLAASYWSLLAPAVEMATSSGGFGAFAFFPVAVGFTLGAAFVYLADLLMPHLGAAEDPQMALALTSDPALVKKKSDPEGPTLLLAESELSIRIGRAGPLSGAEGATVRTTSGAKNTTSNLLLEKSGDCIEPVSRDKSENGEAYQRKKVAAAGLGGGPASPASSRGNLAQPGGSSWRRIALLILAITIHNVPEGLAVGVGFGAVEKTASATFESARSPPGSLAPRESFGLCGSRALRQQPSRAFSIFQELGHRNWDPEFPGGPGRQPPPARGWLLHLESLLVRAAEWHGGAPGWRLWRLRRGAGRAHPALRPGLRGRRHGLCGHGRHHPRSPDQW
ncbi:zinc transporter ZIP11 isoform X4 [Oryctolagus cuniculus]|uniref:zinc transporter ZIP11 isoform X4 n=1 Tax=Oryctolagus cuniculus TaxID=9986 RepID=UPI0038795B31